MTNASPLLIDSITDLLKLSPEKLKTAGYSDFCGKYFEQIKEELIKTEKEKKQNKENKKFNNFGINNNINSNDFEDQERTIIKRKNKKKIGYIYNYRDKIPLFIINNHDSNNEKAYHIKKIIFCIYYNTLFGQEIAISGSSYNLGNWDKKNLFFLNWTEGNKWIGVLDIDDNYEDFEFKFVLCYNKNIISWEPGENNNVYFSGLLNEIKEYQKGKFNKYEYEYNQEDGELTLNCHWPR